jgi:hypothetical protein
MNDTPLAEARARIDAARETYDAAKIQWRDANRAAVAAKAPYDAERHERSMQISRGGPRPAANFVPPKTAAALAADEAQAAFETAEMRMNNAQRALAAAESSLLAIENRILTRWRDQRAREYRQLQLNGAPDEVLAAKLAELRLMCPPNTCVRLHQRFTLSALVREVLDEHPDVLQIDTPVSELRGETSGGYEKRRAEILAAAEAESTQPLEAA